MIKTLSKVNMVNSREVAEMMGKKHYEVIQYIEGTNGITGILQVLNTQGFESSEYFIESSYRQANNKEVKCYQVTKMGCELLANKMTGEKGILFSAKYVQRFNEMEKAIVNQFANLSPELKAIFMIDKKQQKTEKRIDDLEDNMPLFPNECEKLQTEVRSKALKMLGGKESRSYKDKSLRTKVFTDIQNDIRRQFGVKKYKDIKRKELVIAIRLVNNYELPYYLETEVVSLNSQIEF